MIRIDKISDCKKYLEDVTAVVFDLDDTLYSEKEYVRSGYESVGRLFTHITDMADKLWTAFCNNKKAFDEVLKNEDCYSEQTLKKCIDAYRDHTPDIHLYDGVYDLILSLKNDGKKLGIITDGRPRGQRLKIKSLGIDNLFDCIIVTDELGGETFRKPNPAAFVKMSKALQTDFGMMAYIGDNTSKDFVAPDSLGMKSIWFDNKDGIYSEKE